MQSAEKLAFAYNEVVDFVLEDNDCVALGKMIAARDAEWQARVDKLEAALINLTTAVEKHDFLSCSLIAQTQDARAALGREA